MPRARWHWWRVRVTTPEGAHDRDEFTANPPAVSRMRILFLTHRLPYAPNRGDRIRAYHLLQHLSARHQVDLVSLVHDEEEADHAGDLRSMVDSVTIVRAHRLRNAVRGVLPFLSGRPLTHVLLDAPDLRQRISKVIGAHRPDVVLAYCSGMARFALEPPLDTLPFVLDMVDVDSEKWAALGHAGRLPKHWLYRREASCLRAFERMATGRARATLVVNARERESLAAMGVTARIEVVPNGIELTRFRSPHAPSNEPRVVFCGVMSYEPNETGALWLAREVWPRVRAVRPDARLCLLGAEPTRRLRELPRVDASIEVTGSVADVRPFLWSSAVSAAPLFVGARAAEQGARSRCRRTPDGCHVCRPCRVAGGRTTSVCARRYG